MRRDRTGRTIMNNLGILLTATALAVTLAACSDDTAADDDDTSSSGGGSSGSAEPAVPTPAGQIPPQGRDAIESWLKAGTYKGWSSEPAIHEARSPSPHGFNRIYSNDGITKNATSTVDWPEGAAAVKELYDSATATAPSGYAVYVKTKADSAGGANWYWYETVPLDSSAPHDANGVVADGLGGSGTAKSICVGCHAGAGSDSAHTPSPGGRDQVYTPVY